MRIATNNPKVLEIVTRQPAAESPTEHSDAQTGCPSLVSGPTISDNGLLCQRDLGFQAGLDTGSNRGDGEGFYISWLYERSRVISPLAGSLSAGA